MREIVLNGLEKDFRSNEAYKNLRTNIEFSGEENKVPVVHRMRERVRFLFQLRHRWLKAEKKFSLLMRICVNLFWQGVTEYRAS